MQEQNTSRDCQNHAQSGHTPQFRLVKLRRHTFANNTTIKTANATKQHPTKQKTKNKKPSSQPQTTFFMHASHILPPATVLFFTKTVTKSDKTRAQKKEDNQHNITYQSLHKNLG